VNFSRRSIESAAGNVHIVGDDRGAVSRSSFPLNLFSKGNAKVTPKEVLALCREKDVKAVDFRFMDFPGLWQHFTIPAEALDETVSRWQAIMARYGGEAIAGYAYSSHQGLVNRNFTPALFHALGATRVNAGAVCDTCCGEAWELTVGPAGGTERPLC
jgi:hypothetical protein